MDNLQMPEGQPVEYEPIFDLPIELLLEKAHSIRRGEPQTYGATPLDMEETMEQQVELLNDLQHYTYHIPDGVSLEIADYVHQTFRDRFFSRMSANGENYTTSLLRKSYYADDLDILEMIERSETGYASPAELLLVRKLLGIRSVELACLTHPYGERIEPFLEEMQEVVDLSITEMGGKLEANKDAKYRIKDVILKNVPYEEWPKIYTLSNQERMCIADQYGGVAGLLMTRKRTRGYMTDGTVIRERSSLVLRTDEASMVSAEALKAIAGYEADVSWEDEAVDVGELDKIASVLMETDQFSLAIPLASTIYAFNPDTAQRVKAELNPNHFKDF